MGRLVIWLTPMTVDCCVRSVSTTSPPATTSTVSVTPLAESVMGMLACWPTVSSTRVAPGAKPPEAAETFSS
jgi:hypothetical protein